MPSLRKVLVLLQPGFITFLEPPIRYALYLWLMAGDYLPVRRLGHSVGSIHDNLMGFSDASNSSLEATSLAFDSHS
jgi:hypothetical protein